MEILDHNPTKTEKWRKGVLTEMRVSALTGSHQLCLFDQWCDIGLGAPMHIHAVEEVLEVISGKAEIYLGDDSAIVTANQSVLIPAGDWHGFKNVCDDNNILHTRATLASCIFEASYDTGNELSHRWSPGFAPK